MAFAKTIKFLGRRLAVTWIWLFLLLFKYIFIIILINEMFISC